MKSKQAKITSTVGSTIGNPPLSHRPMWGWGVLAPPALLTYHANAKQVFWLRTKEIRNIVKYELIY